MFHAALAWGSESADAQISPEPTSAGITAGFIIKDDEYFKMTNAFFEHEFVDAMTSVELTETFTLMYNPARVNRLLPYLFVTRTDADPFDVGEDMVIVRMIIEATIRLRDKFPDAFLLNREMVEALKNKRLGYMMAEPEIWLWPESRSSVIIPLCFYDRRSMEIVDGFYLLEVTPVDEGALRYYQMYNNSQYVEDYLSHVEINSDKSPFQRALLYWYIQHFLSTWEDRVMGTVRVIETESLVMDDNRVDANVVTSVSSGEEYPTLGKTDNEWYLIHYAEKAFGYISSKEVDFYKSSE